MSTPSYIVVPIETDPNALTKDALQHLMSIAPGWVPHEGNLDVWIIEVVARMEAETRDVASRVTQEIFRFFGKSLLNIPAIDGASATATSTWTMRDSIGYTIPAGALVSYQPSGSSQAYFRVVNPVVVPPGGMQTGTGEVILSALQSGSSGNDLTLGTLTLVDSLNFVASVVAETATAGGVDPETDDAYLNRLRTELQLLAPRPILPDDFAKMALNVAGVGRATAIDGYNPQDQTYNNERMVTVALADAAGRSVTVQIQQAVQAYLESEREVNFVVNVINPTYTVIDVQAGVKIMAGFDPATVIASAVSAVKNYLDPANWQWYPVIRYNEIIALLSDVPGVDYVANVSKPSGDVTLPAPAALVSAGAVTIAPV